MSVGLINRTGTYLKTGALALLVSMSACTKKAPELAKDVVEFSQPTAAKLIQNLENGERHSVVVFLKDSMQQVISKNDINKYEIVPDSLLKKLTTLPDTMRLYFRVYKGKADSAIQKKLKKSDNLLTVGHGNTGRNYISLAGGQKAYEGDYISQYKADSLFNKMLIEKDSILNGNITEEAYQNLNQNEKDALISYLYNVSEKLLAKSDSKRAIPESLFECINNEAKGKVQAKFNVMPSAKSARAGLAKRNLIQLLVYGDGQVYNNKHARKNVSDMLDEIKKRRDKQALLNEIFEKVEQYGVDTTKLAVTKKEFQQYLLK